MSAAQAARSGAHVCGIRFDGAPPEGCPDPDAHRNYAIIPHGRQPRPQADTIKMDIPRPLHPRIVAIRDQLSADTGRSVTLPEAWQAMVEYWEQGHQ